jgi:serine/threonine protein kinase
VISPLLTISCCRDIKPNNILLYGTVDTCRQARIADFGLSVVTSDADNQSQAVQSRCGNLFYQAPELLIGAPAGNSLDIYAFGKQVVECVAGYVVGVSR